jgi:serine/threonine protein kinase
MGPLFLTVPHPEKGNKDLEMSFLIMEYFEGRMLTDVVDEIRCEFVTTILCMVFHSPQPVLVCASAVKEELEVLPSHVADEQVWALAGQVMGALQAMHAEGVVHKDAKGTNVMGVEGEGGGRSVKLVDLGLSRLVGADGLSKSVGGTLEFLSPEVRLVSLQAQFVWLRITPYAVHSLTGTSSASCCSCVCRS